MSIDAVVGGQWGDEGKGKIVDFLSRDAHMVARFQGGANAGHTVYKGKQKIVLHQIPSGILTKNCQCVLGNGMVIDPVDLVEELEMTMAMCGKSKLSDLARDMLGWGYPLERTLYNP